MSRKSIETPPCGALMWPSSEVPVPNGITGTRCCAQMRTASCTSSVDLRKHHRVRRLVLDPGQGVAVLLAHRLRGDEPVAEMRGEFGDRPPSPPAGRAADPPSCELRCDRHGYWTFFQKFPHDANREASRIYSDFRFTGSCNSPQRTISYAGSHRFRACILCAVRVLGPEGGTGLDRSEWPSQHGLLSRAVRPRVGRGF